jgi:hypothetical protein
LEICVALGLVLYIKRSRFYINHQNRKIELKELVDPQSHEIVFAKKICKPQAVNITSFAFLD